MNYNYYAGLVRARLADDGYKIYTDDQIFSYIEGSLRRFNLLFKKNSELSESHHFTDLIVQGAVITGLASKALIESGRNFSYKDAGIEYQSVHLPSVANILMRQWELESNDYWRKVEMLQKYNY